jgi:hypothetical protein
MRSALKWLAFAACVAGLVWGPFARTFEDVQRYGYMPDIMPSDWRATNVWLDSTDCTVARAVWLAVCEGDRLIPISERAIADDPGHALLLNAWAAITGKRATLVDVARLSTLLNTIGLVALAALLFSLGAWITSIVLLALGPAEFLGWMGTSPHWAFIGMVSLAGLLPLAVATRRGWAWIGGGIVALAVVTLVRESIGLMGFALTLGAVATTTLLQRPRQLRALMRPALVILLAMAALLAPKWATMARDAAFPMAPVERLQTHGLSHTLYLGLGFVENKWGIRYDDDYGEDLANKAGLVFCSPEYFRLMWKLYLSRIAEDPIEVGAHLLGEGAAAARGSDALSRPALRPGPGSRSRAPAGGNRAGPVATGGLSPGPADRGRVTGVSGPLPRPGDPGAAQPHVRRSGERLHPGPVRRPRGVHGTGASGRHCREAAALLDGAQELLALVGELVGPLVIARLLPLHQDGRRIEDEDAQDPDGDRPAGGIVQPLVKGRGGARRRRHRHHAANQHDGEGKGRRAAGQIEKENGQRVHVTR